MTATLYLVRHAAHADCGLRLTGRAPGVPLTEEGRAQAASLAKRLAREPIRAVHSSPRERARETAGIIAAALGLAVEIAPALDEIDFGGWTGRSFDELAGEPGWTCWNEARSVACPPGGETMAAATARAATYLRALAAAGGAAVCVSHCDIIRGVVADHLRMPLDEMLRFDVDPASVSVLVIGDWGARLVGLNERIAA